MSKLKDGYWRQISSKVGDDNYLLKAAGGYIGLHTDRNNEANKVVRTDGSGYIQAGWINTTSGNFTGTPTRIYASNDAFIRYMTPANFFPTLVNSGNDISITIGGQNRTLTVGFATNSTNASKPYITQLNDEEGNYPLVLTEINSASNYYNIYKNYNNIWWNPFLKAFGHGVGVQATGASSHAEGYYSIASGYDSHAEGCRTEASGDYTHAEGDSTIAYGEHSHSEGESTKAQGGHSHSEGKNTLAGGANSHAEGYGTSATGVRAHSEGSDTIAAGNRSHAEGSESMAFGYASHAEGNYTTAGVEGKSLAGDPGQCSHSEGEETVASGKNSHAEGYKSQAIGNYSHAEGENTQARGLYTHTEGFQSSAAGDYSHAEGRSSANGQYSHSEGLNSTTSARYAHAEGYHSNASGEASHAEGYEATASGNYSHSSGYNTIASHSYEAAFGKFNVSNSNTLFSIGYGNTNSDRKNLFEVRTNGQIYFNGASYYINGSYYNGTAEYANNLSNPAKYYWANLTLQTGSSDTTVPSFGAIRMNGAASAGTNYITGTAGRIYFGGNFHIDSLGSNSTYINHYTSNNVYLVTGGGNVGIGTASPTHKLYVNGTTYLNGNTTATRIWLNHNSNLSTSYSWTGAALTSPTIEIQNYTGTTESMYPTLTLHHYGYGGPRLGSRQGVLTIYGGNTDARTLGNKNDYFKSMKIYPNEAYDALYVNDIKVMMTNRNVNFNSTSTWNGLTPIYAHGFRHGYPHFNDPDFASGNGGVGYYGRGQSTGTVTRMTDAQALEADSNYFASGNSSGYVIKISNTAVGSNNIGGFVQAVTSGDNKVWVQIFRALLPVGATLSYAANQMGNGAVVQWLTSNVGTGKWEWYAQIFYNGHGGTFSSFGHMSAFLTGGTTSTVWYLSYCNMYELTNGNYDGLRTRYSDYADNVYINGTQDNVNYAMLFTTATANGNSKIYADNQWRTAGITFNPSSNTLNVGSRIVSPYANYTATSMRHLDAGLNSVHTDHGLYIGYGAQTYTAVTHFYYSTGTTDSTSSRTEFMQINSNGAYALTRFGVNGQNTSYNLYVNGTSYLSGNSYHFGSVGIGTTSPTQKLHVSGNGRFDGGIGSKGTNGNVTGSYIVHPNGGVYATNTSSVTGYLKITLPHKGKNCMMSFDVTIYTYDGVNQSYTTYHISGYEYSTNGWYNPVTKVYSEGIGPYTNLTVRLGNDGTYACVTIGEANTVWTYPQVTVHNIMTGYSNCDVDTWIGGWAIGFTTTALTTVVSEKTSVNTQNINVLGSAGSVAWGNITGKPSTFTPSEHNHDDRYVNITGDTMTGPLYINNDTDVGLNQNGSLIIGSKTGQNIAIDGNEIIARNNSAASTLYLNNDGGNIITGSGSVGIGTASPGHKLVVNGNFSSSNYQIYGSTGGTNCNSATYTGIWYYSSNGPVTQQGASTADGGLWTEAYSDSWVGQIAQDYRNGTLFTRSRNNGTWTRWKTIAPADSDFEMAPIANIVYNPYGRKFTKFAGTNGSWDTHAYSTVGYKECRLTYKIGQTNAYIMVGLNSDPTYNASYNSIDYCWYTQNDGNLNMYESGSGKSSITGHTSYSAGDEFVIEYSEGYVRYYHNGVLCREIARSYDTPLYFDSSFYNYGYIYDVVFEPIRGAMRVDLMSKVTDWNTVTTSIFKSSENSTTNAPTTGFIYGTTLRFHRDWTTHYTDLVVDLYNDKMFFRRKTDGGFGSWRELLHSGNTYVSSGKGYINNTEITYVNNAGNASAADKLNFERVSDMHATTGWRFFTLNNRSPSNGPSTNGWAQGVTFLPNNDTGGYRHIITFWGEGTDNELWIKNQWNGTWGSWRKLLTSANSSVSKSGETLTVKINGTSYSLTNSTYNFYGTTFYSGYSSGSEHNCNNATANGHYYYNSNGPSGIGNTTDDGALYVQSHSSNWVGQIAQDYRNGRLFVRGRNNGSWTSWLRVALYSEIPTSVSVDYTIWRDSSSNVDYKIQVVSSLPSSTNSNTFYVIV